ncbi:hypothetical protein M378DRAFT_864569 [Amanita muscaria Koide BX008]|uniref:Secreted protein n=1 Tax=Amanita muscaria (strain Koide BX008) TaxID=946122 RepID=A0A0C2WIA2_AMAMK|nr:hypothetical protein M378DRAFT_864569 [Amanita muscaria Koide BX008]
MLSPTDPILLLTVVASFQHCHGTSMRGWGQKKNNRMADKCAQFLQTSTQKEWGGRSACWKTCLSLRTPLEPRWFTLLSLRCKRRMIKGQLRC